MGVEFLCKIRQRDGFFPKPNATIPIVAFGAFASEQKNVLTIRKISLSLSHCEIYPPVYGRGLCRTEEKARSSRFGPLYYRGEIPLFYKDHFFDRGVVSCFHAIEVHATGNGFSGVINAVPRDGIELSFQIIIYQSAHLFSLDVVDHH